MARRERSAPELDTRPGAQARRHRTGTAFGLALREGAGRGRGVGRQPRRGVDTARSGRLGGDAGPAQARVHDADRVVQGPRHDGDGELPPEPRHRPGPRGLVRERGRLAVGLRRGRRHAVPHPGARDGVVPEDRPDRGLRRRRGDDSGLAPGRGRSGPAPGRRDLLREPQLAAPLRGGRQDARLRAVGAARLPRARQRRRAPRLRQQRAGVRAGIRRAPARRRDRHAAPALRGAGGELRTLPRRLPGGSRSAGADHRHPDRRRGHRVCSGPPASGRCCGPCARAEGPSSR